MARGESDGEFISFVFVALFAFIGTINWAFFHSIIWLAITFTVSVAIAEAAYVWFLHGRTKVVSFGDMLGEKVLWLIAAFFLGTVSFGIVKNIKAITYGIVGTLVSNWQALLAVVVTVIVVTSWAYLNWQITEHYNQKIKGSKKK